MTTRIDSVVAFLDIFGDGKDEPHRGKRTAKVLIRLAWAICLPGTILAFSLIFFVLGIWAAFVDSGAAAESFMYYYARYFGGVLILGFILLMFDGVFLNGFGGGGE